MEILQGLDGLRSLPHGAAVSIGNFDGLHRGHAHILDRGRALAAEHAAAHLAVVTFEPHPLTVLRPELAPPRLTPSARKRALLSTLGVTHLVELPPEQAVLDLEAEAFWQMLRDEVKPSCLIEGDSFVFGKNRGGTIDKLRQWVHDTHVRLDVVEPVQVALLDMTIVRVSSSLIRWLLSHGRVRDAAICLGRPYLLEGQVIKGHQRGRTIGVPTANLQNPAQLLPADAVYAGRSRIAGQTYPAAVSVGTMPTFGPDLQRQVEVHLIGFNGDLYGQWLEVELLDWLREQRKYNALDALKAQMTRDLADTTDRQRIDPSRAIAKPDLITTL